MTLPDTSYSCVLFFMLFTFNYYYYFTVALFSIFVSPAVFLFAFFLNWLDGWCVCCPAPGLCSTLVDYRYNHDVWHQTGIRTVRLANAAKRLLVCWRGPAGHHSFTVLLLLLVNCSVNSASCKANVSTHPFVLQRSFWCLVVWVVARRVFLSC